MTAARVHPLDHFMLAAPILLQQLKGDVRHRADTRVADAELARVGLGIVDHGLEVADGRVETRNDGCRDFDDQRDRHQVARRIIRQTLEHEFVESRQ
jgi:hypothetical protein